MSKKREFEFDPDVRKALASDPGYAAEYFAELMRRPLPVQLALLRKLLGMTQERLAKGLGLRQTHVSRLEKADSDHLCSLYAKAAERLGAHLAIVPRDMAVLPKAHLQRLLSSQP